MVDLFMETISKDAENALAILQEDCAIGFSLNFFLGINRKASLKATKKITQRNTPNFFMMNC